MAVQKHVLNQVDETEEEEECNKCAISLREKEKDEEAARLVTEYSVKQYEHMEEKFKKAVEAADLNKKMYENTQSILNDMIKEHLTMKVEAKSMVEMNKILAENEKKKLMEEINNKDGIIRIINQDKILPNKV